MLRAVGEVGFGLPFHAIVGKEGFEGFEGGAGSCTHGGSPVVGQDCPHNPRCAWAGRVSLFGGDFNEVVECEMSPHAGFGVAGGVFTDGMKCADLFVGAVFVDEVVAYIKTAKVCANGVHGKISVRQGKEQRPALSGVTAQEKTPWDIVSHQNQATALSAAMASFRLSN
jgi:hypothetical protein